jgi:hypothetical protein
VSKSKYIEKGLVLGQLVDAKNKQYGDSFSKSQEIIKVLYPAGVQPNQYKDLLTITRIIDKLFRIANGNQGGEDAWDDIVGYGILGGVNNEKT